MPQLSPDFVKLPFRSMGVKLIVVCFLAVIMTIPALFVWSLIDDRTNRADEVIAEVSSLVGGPQTFLGPILAIPYTVPANLTKPEGYGVYVVFPATAKTTVNTRSEVRHRSLFKVPVYHADIAFAASFDIPATPANAPEGAVLDWNRAEFLVGATDARGAQAEITLNTGENVVALAPAAALQAITVHLPPGGDTQLALFGTPANLVANPNQKFNISAELKFTGAQRLAVLAFGKTTTVSVDGDWQHPSFNGGYLPVTQNLTDRGFTANWSVPFIARGVPAEGNSEVLTRLGRTAMGVSFVEVADPYQSVTRSLKYALLFIGLVFLSYFLFEVGSGKRVHPAQYIMIGVAQVVFYLLLLSIAERIGFDLAFAIAATATVVLISAYARWIFASRRYGFRALAVFSALYALIYLLLRLEDQALLVGALASFAAISAVMYFTRHMDWYATSAPSSSPLPETDRLPNA
ncbi:MAG: cell envelope integrity protein CreD [Candidatus Korobacteraceae bacterium]